MKNNYNHHYHIKTKQTTESYTITLPVRQSHNRVQAADGGLPESLFLSKQGLLKRIQDCTGKAELKELYAQNCRRIAADPDLRAAYARQRQNYSQAA